ncbi:MAG: glycosyltransferase family 4 protein [Candidatus Magasanikbacteria bacterium]|jgi:glycosyltransferase involved in cell wall biosynthesis
MRIAMIGQKGIPAAAGGVERHVEELSKQLAQNGHEVLVYARRWYGQEKNSTDFVASNLSKNIQIIYTPSLHTKNLDAITHTITATIHALTQKIDVIHFHGVGPALLSWLPRLLAPRVRVIATFHSMDRYQYKWGKIAKWFLSMGEIFICRWPHATITVSRGLYHYCLNQYQKITICIPSGVPIWDGKKYPEKLSNYNLTPEKYLLTVARIIRGKGIHHLISAWKTLRARAPQIIEGYKLAIVGDGEEAYMDELFELSGSDSDIIFTGDQYGENLQTLFTNAKLFIHPSENEGLPLAVLEAMSFGLPVVVSDIPGHREIVPDNQFWFDTANADSLTERLKEILPQTELLKKTGEQNRALVMEKYSWRDIALQVEQVYQSNEKNKKIE